ncbi:MAG: DUF5717 family protein [Blautia sp.]
MVIQADKMEASYDAMPQTIRESLTLTKSNWGFFKLEVASDADFLKVEHPVVTTDEFIREHLYPELSHRPGGASRRAEFWKDPDPWSRDRTDF